MIRPDSLYKKQETDIHESMSAPTGLFQIFPFMNHPSSLLSGKAPGGINVQCEFAL